MYNKTRVHSFRLICLTKKKIYSPFEVIRDILLTIHHLDTPTMEQSRELSRYLE